MSVNELAGPGAKGRDLAGFGLRQTWRQWRDSLDRHLGKPENAHLRGSDGFEDPWASWWRSGATASEAVAGVRTGRDAPAARAGGAGGGEPPAVSAQSGSGGDRSGFR